MDPRAYVTLEQSLARRLQSNWVQRSSGLLLEIEQAVMEGRWLFAREMTKYLDLSEAMQGTEQYARYLLQSCVLFGARSVADVPGVMLDSRTSGFIDASVTTLGMYLEASGTLDLQRRALQLIADLEYEKVVLKADAPRKVRPFVSFQNLGESQAQLISSLHSSRLAVWGFTAEAEILEVRRYKLNAVLDGRTSDFCRLIHGKEFSVVDARKKILEVLSAQDPNDLKTLQPWPSQSKASLEEISKLSEEELVGRGLHIPPFHPGCRTLLVLVSKLSRLSKPQPTGPTLLKPSPATVEKFKEIGVEITQPAVDHWNAYVGIDPAQWLGSMTATSPLKYLEGVVGKNSIKVLPDGDILTKVKGKVGSSKFTMGAILDPYSGRMYLSQADFILGDVKADASLLSNLLSGVIDTGASIGVSTVVLPVGGQAFAYSKLGFVPNVAQWQEIRLKLLQDLETGPLTKVLASMTDEQQQLLLNLLSNQSPQALSVLVDLTVTYRGKYVGELLLEHVSGDFELDIGSPLALAKSKEYLK
jgi:hypothetical protein